MPRPESDGRGYELPDDYDRDAWQEFTPWRPGDPSAADEAPTSYAADGATPDGWSRSRGHAGAGREHPQKTDKQRPVNGDQDQPRRRWWTEDQPDRFASGDQVRNRGNIGSDFMTHVPANTRGKIVGTRLGMLGGDYATVEFESGYTEEVPMNKLKRDTWW